MKQTCSCLFLILMYSVAGVFSVSTQKSKFYETTEDKFVAHQKHIRELVVRLLCNTLDDDDDDDALNSAAAGDQRSSKGDELLLTSGDLDRRLSLNGIRCRMRSPSSSSDDDGDGDDGSDEIAVSHLRRQVDPLQSCIEAKCSGWHPPGSYQECIYRHCISTFNLGLRSLRNLASKRNARTSSSATTDHPKTSKEKDKEERHSTMLRGGSLGKEEEEEEEEDEDGGGRGRATGTTGSSSSSSNGMEAMRLRVMRRGFNDIADVCVQHHCGSFNSHSMEFFSCVESHCAFR